MDVRRVGRTIRFALVRRLGRRDARPVNETIVAARKASDAMSRTIPHNPDGPDADLRYLPGGAPGPW